MNIWTACTSPTPSILFMCTCHKLKIDIWSSDYSMVRIDLEKNECRV